VTSIYPPQLGCHHQKTFVVDGRVAFVGGINMTQDYWDTCDHKSLDDRRVSYDVTDDAQRRRLVASALPLHDLFARFDGSPVADVEANFVERWNGATVRGGRDLTSALPAPDGGGAVRMQVLRTLAPNSYPHTSAGETSIKEAMLNVIAAARNGIYLENQYFFDDDIVSALRSAGERGVRVVGLLTRRPDAGQFVGALEALLEDGSESRFQWTHFNPALKQRIQLYTPFTSDGANPKDIYVHSKTMVVDDEWVITGSANISFTSMDFHSEMSILVEDKVLARGLRGRLWAEHLCCAEGDVPDDFERGADLWKAHGERNAELLRKGAQLPTRVVPLAPPTTFVPDILVTGTNSEDDVSLT
jgi:phospholipase D1/2